MLDKPFPFLHLWVKVLWPERAKVPTGHGLISSRLTWRKNI